VEAEGLTCMKVKCKHQVDLEEVSSGGESDENHINVPSPSNFDGWFDSIMKGIELITLSSDSDAEVM